MENKIILSYLRKIPVEVYVLMILPFLGILWIFIFYPAPLSFSTLLFYLFFGDSSHIVMIVAFLYIYFSIRVIFPPLKFFILNEKSNIRNVFSEMKKLFKLFKELAYFLLTVFFGGIFLNLSLNNLSEKSAPGRIIWSNNLLADYDYLLFGKDILFLLNDIVNKTGGIILSHLLIGSYELLLEVLAVFLIILFLSNKTLAKKFIFFFFIIQFIILPFWYFFPALEPISMYLSNALKTDMRERIAFQLENYQPDSALGYYQQKAIDYDNKYDDYLALTAFPSMHAGWGLGFILYGFMLYRPLIIFLLPWYILEITGALYVGRHYAVDIFLGMAMAAIAYLLVELIFFIEKKYYKGKGSLFIIDILQEDFRKFFNFYKKEIWKLKK